MSERVRICWEVNDGYVGKDRPHYLYVDREEWESMSDGERHEYVHDAAMEEISISWEEKEP